MREPKCNCSRPSRVRHVDTPPQRRCRPTPASSFTTARAVTSASNPKRATVAFFARLARCRVRRPNKTASVADRCNLRRTAGGFRVKLSNLPWKHREGHAPDGARKGLRNQQAILPGHWLSTATVGRPLVRDATRDSPSSRQDYYVEDWAHNFVMHVLVTDLEEWWRHISGLICQRDTA